MLQASKLKLSIVEAILILGVVLAIISISIIGFGIAAHLAIIFAIMALLLFGRIKGVQVSDMEKGMFKGAASGLGAVYLFFFIGMLISSWMASGTIPTLMYYGIEWFSGLPIYVSVFIVCAAIGTFIGSAFTTAATMGVAFIGMATAMDASLAITAGAVVSGAFLGDKMSPLSDTTNLASETVGVPIFEHIKNLMWTTVPAFIISAIIFYFLSPVSGGKTVAIKEFLSVLQEYSFIGVAALIPFAIVVILAVCKSSAITSLSGGIISAIVIAFITNPNLTLSAMSQILFSGFVMDSNVAELNSVLSRGGIESMLSSVALVLLALGMGGLLFLLGIIPTILLAIEGALTNAFRLIIATACTAIGINVFIGEQYLSILLTGKTFENQYVRLGYSRKTLSRALEDTGTVINPLIPWGVSGVFISGVLGVSTIQYAPFAFFCLLCPVLTVLSGLTQIGIKKEERMTA